MSRRAVRWLVVALSDGSEVVASPRIEHLGAPSRGEYVVSRAMAGGTVLGLVRRKSPGAWVTAASHSLDSADAIWNEQPVWPTLRDACESLVAARAT